MLELTRYDTAEELKSNKEIIDYLEECFKESKNDDNYDFMISALNDAARAIKLNFVRDKK
jgi:DNA-binding phage protein